MIRPMLATAGPLPQGAGWLYEVKWDGYRAIYVDGRFYGRSGRQLSGPRLPDWDVPVDGELVAFDNQGKPSFHAIQTRGPTGFIAFDIIIAGMPLEHRRSQLERLDATISPTFADGKATIAAARELGLEGVVAKRLGSLYRPGVRSPDWVKHTFTATADFVIGGWYQGERRLGSLLIGAPTATGLAYRGRVGSGLTEELTDTLLPVLSELSRSDSPFNGPTDVPGNWVEPLLVVEVRYNEITPDRRLRAPVFIALRPDKLPSDCVDEG